MRAQLFNLADAALNASTKATVAHDSSGRVELTPLDGANGSFRIAGSSPAFEYDLHISLAPSAEMLGGRIAADDAAPTGTGVAPANGGDLNATCDLPFHPLHGTDMNADLSVSAAPTFN